jgi:hypothetical protein
MKPGFVLDHTHHSTAAQQHWVEGEPERSFWFGLKTKGRQKLPVRTYRCDRCGCLESYARAE